MIVVVAIASAFGGLAVGFMGAAFIAARGRPCQWCDEPDREVLGQ